jgi:hypothetical protein
MYLHIGNEISIPLKEIIAIIGLDAVESALSTQELLELAENKHDLIAPAGESKPKSCIITSDKYYLSTISAMTLARRAKQWGIDI